jgi:uncharacterized repeat protein (TIGR03803 family)
MHRLSRLLLAAVAAACCCAPLWAQTYQYEVIHAFAGPDGRRPLGTLFPVGSDFYGTTSAGGDTSGLCTPGCGTTFRIDSSNTLTTLHVFDSSTDGFPPFAGLVSGGDGNYYGTTVMGGALGDGAVFRMDPAGIVTTVHDFDHDTEGWSLETPLILADDGNLYGTTLWGTCSDGRQICGTLFRLTTAGDLTPLHTFDTGEGHLSLSPLLQTTSIDFYGATTLGGGANPNVCGEGCGTVFHMSVSGTLTTVHAFDSDDGNSPIGALIQADGNIYGVTEAGGTSGLGTIYRIDAQGGFTSLHSFDGTDGSNPEAGLVVAPDGNFYGTTESGGQFGFGTVFRMDAAGNVVAVHHFDGSSASAPEGSIGFAAAELVVGGDGKLYGARFRGGDGGFLYRISSLPTAPLFCPNAFVRRDQMAVFLLKTEHGSSYTPPTCSGVFPDVACPSLFADWIENLASEGITAGCGGGDYCPLSPITRGQMAVFLLKTEHGSSYAPPSCAGIFPDVPCGSQFSDWIEQLANEGITGGCGAGNFCPGNPVTRAQMAVFLLKVEHGAAFVPPACVPLFADVTCPSLFADWIEQLYAEGITAGCAGAP